MKIDIIIPVRNQPERLLCCLKSLIPQAEYINNIIIVDNGSKVIVENLIKAEIQEECIKVVRTEKIGRSHARNTGIIHSTSEYILFLDGDRVVKNGSLKAVDQAISKYRDGIFIASIYETFLNEKEILNLYKKDGNISEQIHKIRIYSYYKFICRGFRNNVCFLKNPWIATFSGSMCISREALTESGFFDEDFSQWGLENFELGYRLCNKGYCKYFILPGFETIHLAHKREKNMYRDGIKSGIEIFLKKHRDLRIIELKKMLEGDITLAEFDGTLDVRLNCYYKAFSLD